MRFSPRKGWRKVGKRDLEVAEGDVGVPEYGCDQGEGMRGAVLLDLFSYSSDEAYVADGSYGYRYTFGALSYTLRIQGRDLSMFSGGFVFHNKSLGCRSVRQGRHFSELGKVVATSGVVFAF